MNASEIAEVILRLRERLIVTHGESENSTLLSAAETAAFELLRPPTTEELVAMATFGSYVGSEAVRKIGEANATSN